jgi:hypothetical protein
MRKEVERFILGMMGIRTFGKFMAEPHRARCGYQASSDRGSMRTGDPLLGL